MQSSTFAGLPIRIASLLCLLCSCATEERKPTVHTPKEISGSVTCVAPPQEMMTREVVAEADILVHKIGQLVKGSAGVRIGQERIRQELHPQVANFEVIHYRMCLDYVNGLLDKSDYNKYLAQILPELKEISPSSSITQTSHGKHSPNVVNQGNGTISIGVPPASTDK